MPETRTFEEGIADFEDFLRQNGYATNLLWVEPADVVLSGCRKIYVRPPVPARNLERARQLFALGMSEGLGVTFGTICELPNATCCYVWVPKNHGEQERHMMGRGLKMSAKTDRLTGTPVDGWFRWQILKLRYRRHTCFNEELFG